MVLDLVEERSGRYWCWGCRNALFYRNRLGECGMCL